MRLDYNDLRKMAQEVRAELIERGEIDPGRQRIRRKPRSPEKLGLLYRMAIDRLERYPPYRDEKGRLVLPYFK